MTTAFQPPVPQFLGTDEKNDLVNSHEQFTITNVITGPGKFGKAHTYELRLASVPEPVYISFSSNPRRDIEASYIQDILVNDVVGPVCLSKVPSDKGNDAWIFVNPESVVEPKSKK